jgi:hypothetical protein
MKNIYKNLLESFGAFLVFETLIAMFICLWYLFFSFVLWKWIIIDKEVMMWIRFNIAGGTFMSMLSAIVFFSDNNEKYYKKNK